MLLSLAILTKQQTLPILLAMATVFVVRRGAFGACLRFAALALAVSVGLYGAFYLATGGDIVLHTIVYPSRLAGDPAITNLANAWPRLRDLGLAYWGLFLLYALALAAHRPDPALADEAATLRAIAAGGNTLVNSEGSIPFVAVTPEIPVKYFDVADMGFSSRSSCLISLPRDLVATLRKSASTTSSSATPSWCRASLGSWA